jgi:hypothetical protein
MLSRTTGLLPAARAQRGTGRSVDEPPEVAVSAKEVLVVMEPYDIAFGLASADKQAKVRSQEASKPSGSLR